jgi:alpha-glucosidase
LRRKDLNGQGSEALTRPWWRGAVFYEIYIRSFADSNNDGIGDLRGISSRLEYLKDLGIDAIWITPFYPSPQKDHGYDIADYCHVNPEYGTLADFSHLIDEAHRLRMKILVDLVPNHTSDQHPWFQAAVSAPDDPHRARYYFADAKPDGSPPNNWESAFGGSAWTQDQLSGQWYLHLFAPEQPDLNWWNPAVPKEFERILKFWLDKGVDGYRIDVASALFKRRDMADRPMIKDPLTGLRSPDLKFKIIDQPEVHDVYRAWRRILDEYQPTRVLVGALHPGRMRPPAGLSRITTWFDTSHGWAAAPWAALAPAQPCSCCWGCRVRSFFIKARSWAWRRRTSRRSSVRTRPSFTVEASRRVGTGAACRCPGTRDNRTQDFPKLPPGCQCRPAGTVSPSMPRPVRPTPCSSSISECSP